MDIDKNIITYWNNADKFISHLDYNYTRHAFPVWEKYFLSSIDFNDKTVIDYGIGGGFLGQILLNKYNIAKYIGIDISQRQLEEAKKNINNDKTEFLLCPVDLSTIDADILISQSVIQHFPTETILIDFLKNVNNSMCHTLILQIRYGELTKFSNNYANKKNVLYACYTNQQFIANYLPNYCIKSESDINTKTNYQNLIFTRN